MASYLIKYLDGETETVQADTLEDFGVQYVGYAEGVAVAFIPTCNVRSVVRLGALSKRGEGDFEQFRQQTQDEIAVAHDGVANALRVSRRT
ncbi:hypothetical protein [Streptomyces sp. NBC_01565]|uniref:hypothetical protein n=1 Tax=Streptomyces sp. NBC_01565 TaxID=2975881 RepID=UPI0022568144|nr:hypothetical protein [Streptomyces sp. NBC_01565]MCX4543784.1 hypothetical protein [Streptomyces sp. NBC_01565]